MADTMNENGQVVKKETTEIIDNTVALGENTIAGLNAAFDKIETGKEEGVSAADSIKEPEKADDKQEDKQEFKPNETGAENKDVKPNPEAGKSEAKPEKKDEVPEDELKVLPHDKPATAKRIQALLAKTKTLEESATNTKKEAEEKAAKLAELEKKLSEVKAVDPKAEEEVKKKLDELAMYRRRYEIENDPSIKTKFDARIEQGEKTINDTLARRNAGDGLIKLIKDEGGWNRFSESGRVVTIPWTDEDGNKATKQVSCAELSEILLTALPLADRKQVEAAMVTQINAKSERDLFIKTEQEQAKEYFTKRELEAQEAAKAQQAQVEEAGKFVTSHRNKILSEEWVKDREIPANATEQERVSIKAFNESNVKIREGIEKAFSSKTVPELMEVVTNSVKYLAEQRTTETLKREVEKLKADLDAKSKELDRYKTSGRAVGRSGSIATPANSDRTGEERPKTLEEELEAIESSRR